MSATRIRRRLDCALDDRIPHWMASPYSRLKRALFDPEIFEAKVNQARADDSAKARVPNQQAQVDRARADVKNAPAAHAEGKTQTARVRVMVADAKRDLDRKPEPIRRKLIAKRQSDSGSRRRRASPPLAHHPRVRLRSMMAVVDDAATAAVAGAHDVGSGRYTGRGAAKESEP